MLDENDWAWIARYAAGECSPEEAEELRRWIEGDPSRREALGFIQRLDPDVTAGRPTGDADASWARLTARKSARERRARFRPQLVFGVRELSWWRRTLRIAAVVFVVAGGYLIWTRSGPSSTHLPAPVAAREYRTPRGQRAIFHLPDGSRVLLGVASHLRYAGDSGSTGVRDMELDGEALFEVHHDPKRPFVVRTAQGITRDIGTRFAIQAYRTDTALRVVVTEGSVELRSHRLLPSDRGAVLTAGQLGQLGPGGDALVRSGIDLSQYLAWTEGRLVLDDVPVRDALPQLSRWYDLDFVLTDSSLGSRRITATLANEALTQTLELLTSSLDLRYRRRGRTVTLFAAPGPR